MLILICVCEITCISVTMLLGFLSKALVPLHVELVI